MPNRRKYSSLAILVVLLLAAGCASTSKTSRTNLAFLYQNDKQFTHPGTVVHHSTDTTSDLYVKVHFSDLLYQKDPFTGLYSCSYRLTCRMWKGYESPEIIFMTSEVSGDSINYGRRAATVHDIVLPAKYPNNYVVEVEVFDLNRMASSKIFIDIHKSTLVGRQSFLLFGRDEQLLFRDFVYPDESFRVVSGNREARDLFVSCYFRDFPLARPPYTEDREPVFEYAPDSTFSVPMISGQTAYLTFTRLGFYHFRTDTSQREGLTVFILPEGFPAIYTAEQLRDPLRYITTKKEYDSLLTSDQPKAAVDNFWLKTAGSPERAKTLIQKYYGNVEESNEFFTSYQEGWRTDRGLIYTVLGKPKYVYRSDNSEEWIYGEPQNRNSLRFTFIQVKNPFTDNDYMLLRSPTFKDPWFITVQSWRR